MLYIACTILVLQLIYRLIIRKESIFAPVPMFSLVWAVVILFYKSGYVELYPLNFRTELAVLIGSLGFILGSAKFKISSRVIEMNSEGYFHTHSYVLRTKLVIVISLVIIVYQLYQGMHSLTLLRSGFTFENITVERLYNQNTGALSTLLSVYIVSPFTYFFIPLGAYHLVSEKGDKRLAVCSVLLALVTTLHHGGRASIIYFVLYMIAFRSLLGKKSKMRLKTKIVFATIVIVLLIFVDKLSKSRGTTSYIDSIFIYVCGCLPNMDQRLFMGDSNPITFGAASFYGLIAPIVFALRGIGIPYPEFFVRLQDVVNVENVVRIGPSTSYNAFVSIYYYLFMDGRELLIFIGTFVFSAFALRQFKKAKASLEEREIVFYGLLLFQIVFSMIRVHFATWNYALSFIYLIFLYKKKRRGWI